MLNVEQKLSIQQFEKKAERGRAWGGGARDRGKQRERERVRDAVGGCGGGWTGEVA